MRRKLSVEKIYWTLVVYIFNYQNLHYLDFISRKWSSFIYFFLDKLYSIAIIKPEAVITGKTIEIKEKVSDILQ